MTAERLVDTRGLRCPWPVIRLGRAAREMGGPGYIRILADDPLAPGEIAELCGQRGWRMSAAQDSPHAFQIVIDTVA
jgi:tRNA 2-thiouridine synthesizing protein A